MRHLQSVARLASVLVENDPVGLKRSLELPPSLVALDALDAGTWKYDRTA